MSARQRAESDRTTVRLIPAGIFVLALAVRALHLLALRDAPFYGLLMGDARSYHEWAQRIAAGDWLGQEVFYQAPLYPYFLGTLYALFGEDLGVVLWCQAILGAAACALLAHAATRLHSPAAGLVAGTILALYAPAIFFDGLIQKSVLDLFLLCLLLAIASGLPSSGRRRWIAAGAVCGALALARENALILAPVLLLWTLWRAERRRASAGLFLLGLGAVLVPVAARNAAVGGEIHLTTSQLGPNLYIGNGAGASGLYRPLVPGRGGFEFERLDATRLAERDLGRALAPGEVSRYWARRTLGDVAEDPGRWLALLARKLYLALNVSEVVDTEDQATYAAHSPVLRILGVFGHFGVLVPLAALGVWATWRRDRRWALVHLLALAYLASVVGFYVFARYRFPLVPFLVLLAAAALVELPRRWRAGSRRRVAAGVAGALALAAVVNRPAVATERMRAVTERAIGAELARRGDPHGALRHYRRAVELDPESAPAHYDLGTTLHTLGDAETAVAALRRALELDPGHARAATNLGVAAAALGRDEEAEAAFRRAVELDPDDAVARVNLARAHHRRGELDRALAELDRALDADPDHAPAHAARGDVLAARGELEAAAAAFREALRRAPSAALHRRLGLVEQTRGHLEAAREALEAAVAADPGFALARNDLGNLLRAMGLFDQAAAQYREVTRLEPRNPYGHANLGVALYAAGRDTEAALALRTALELAPELKQQVDALLERYREERPHHAPR